MAGSAPQEEEIVPPDRWGPEQRHTRSYGLRLRLSPGPLQRPRLHRSRWTRGDCPNFEPARAVAPFAGPLLGPVEPFILDADRLLRRTA